IVKHDHSHLRNIKINQQPATGRRNGVPCGGLFRSVQRPATCQPGLNRTLNHATDGCHFILSWQHGPVGVMAKDHAIEASTVHFVPSPFPSTA
ncbi:MAG: hypothetical protein ACRERS_07220, partial [Methylococcales bacterium]